MNLPQLFTVTPDPPVCGQPVKICYNFDGAPPGTNTVTVRVKFTPPGTSQDYQLTLTEPCVQVDVPGEANFLDILDLNGHSRAWQSVCDPGP